MRFPNKGFLKDTTFTEILLEASTSQLTGMIRVEQGPVIKVIYFQTGVVAFASSNEKRDRLTEILKRAGKLTPEQVEDAQARQKPNVSLGKILMELGYVSTRELRWGAKTQVEGILHDLLFWKSGTFQILEGPLPREVIHLNLPVAQVIYEGIAKCRDRNWVLEQIESPEAVYVLSHDYPEKNLNYALSVDDIAAELDGQKSLLQIAEATRKDAFDVCKSVAAMQILGLCLKSEPPENPIEIALEEPELQAFQVLELITEEEPFGVAVQEEEPVPAADIKDNEEQPFPEALTTPAAIVPAVSLVQLVQLPTVEDLQQSPETVSPLEPEPVLDTSSSLERVPLQDHATLHTADSNRNRYVIIAAIVLMIVIAAWWFLSRPVDSPASSVADVPTANANGPAGVLPAEIPAPQPETQPVTSIPPQPAPEPDSPQGLTKQGKVPEAALQWREQYEAAAGGYTIQLAIACQAKTIGDSLTLFQDAQEFAALPLKYKGQDCYRLVYGKFSSKAEAESSISSLPPEFRNQPSPPGVISIAKALQ